MHGCKRDAVHGFHYSGRACVEECVGGSKKQGVPVESRVKYPRSAGQSGRMTRAVEGVRPQLVRERESR